MSNKKTAAAKAAETPPEPAESITLICRVASVAQANEETEVVNLVAHPDPDNNFHNEGVEPCANITIAVQGTARGQLRVNQFYSLEFSEVELG